MFTIRKHDGVQFPSTRLYSCEKFKELSPKRKAIILEELAIYLLRPQEREVLPEEAV